MTAFQQKEKTGVAPFPSPRNDPLQRWRADVELLAEFYEKHGLGHNSRKQASKLIASTGHIGAALSASPSRLKSIGASDAEIRILGLLQATVATVLRRPIEERPLLDKLSRVIDYLHARMAWQRSESFHVLFLTGRLRLIHDETLAIGSVAGVEIHPRTVLAKALEANARKLLLVHNHPSGDPAPSREDVQLTARIRDAGRVMDVEVIDHIVIAETGHASLRSLGLM